MTFVHLGELEKAKVFPNSLPPLPAAVDEAIPNGRAWTKPFVAIEPAAREKQLVAQGEANCDTDCSMRI